MSDMIQYTTRRGHLFYCRSRQYFTHRGHLFYYRSGQYTIRRGHLFYIWSRQYTIQRGHLFYRWLRQYTIWKIILSLFSIKMIWLSGRNLRHHYAPWFKHYFHLVQRMTSRVKIIHRELIFTHRRRSCITIQYSCIAEYHTSQVNIHASLKIHASRVNIHTSRKITHHK